MQGQDIESCLLQRNELLSLARRWFDAALDAEGDDAICILPAELRGAVFRTLLGCQHLDEQTPLESLVIDESLTLDLQRTRSGQPDWTQHASDGASEQALQLAANYCKSRSTPYQQGLLDVIVPLLYCFRQSSQPWTLTTVSNVLYALCNQYLSVMRAQHEMFTLRSYFELLSLLLSYHDPELYHHLNPTLCPSILSIATQQSNQQQHQHQQQPNDLLLTDDTSIDLLEHNSESTSPQLYALPWFLTLFARDLSLDCTLQLWDILLVDGDPSLVFYIALSTLIHHRAALLSIRSMLQLPIELRKIRLPTLNSTFWQRCLLLRCRTPLSMGSLFQRCQQQRLLPIQAQTLVQSLHAIHTMPISAQELCQRVLITSTSSDPVDPSVASLGWCRSVRMRSTVSTRPPPLVIIDCRSKLHHRTCGHLSSSLHLSRELVIDCEQRYHRFLLMRLTHQLIQSRCQSLQLDPPDFNALQLLDTQIASCPNASFGTHPLVSHCRQLFESITERCHFVIVGDCPTSSSTSPDLSALKPSLYDDELQHRRQCLEQSMARIANHLDDFIASLTSTTLSPTATATSNSSKLLQMFARKHAPQTPEHRFISQLTNLVIDCSDDLTRISLQLDAAPISSSAPLELWRQIDGVARLVQRTLLDIGCHRVSSVAGGFPAIHDYLIPLSKLSSETPLMSHHKDCHLCNPSDSINTLISAVFKDDGEDSDEGGATPQDRTQSVQESVMSVTAPLTELARNLRIERQGLFLYFFSCCFVF